MEAETAAAQALDGDYEGIQGLTETGQAGLLMQRYLHEYQLPGDALGGFPVLAHANAVNNPFAIYRRTLSFEVYAASDKINDPLNLYDAAPYADGAAAIILTRRDLLPKDCPYPIVRVMGSSVAIDTLALHDRKDPMAFEAARRAAHAAGMQAGILPAYADLIELDDSFSIYAALTLEACSFAEKGKAAQMARDGLFATSAKLPVLTMGGCKGRGNPLGAKGVYQAVEATLQLRGLAGKNQVPGARIALTLALGGPASTAIAHMLVRED
jgi:acetyl-CoA C-acetyltransferase